MAHAGGGESGPSGPHEQSRVSFGKVAEYQKRGAVHFHAVIRFDGFLGEASAAGDFAAEVDREVAPQVGGVVVPEHRAGVVVRVRVERCAQLRGVLRVLGTAAAGAGARPVVNRAERRGGECGEDAGVVADGVGSAFGGVAAEAGADEVVGVAGVGPGAGGAAGGAAVAAGDAQDGAGFVVGGVSVEDSAGGGVEGFGGAGEADGVGAAAGAADLVLPAVEAGGSGHLAHVGEGGRVQARRLEGGVGHAATSWRAVARVRAMWWV
ncbi:hypothetical protein Sdia_12490 [Streptomyces diastaticus subsp. diastaticus]|uniref:Uncharacterized protein n=1 Tax=Streptomyces diastaticus subsp. diastaticus TaxID=68040 RepID=A0ABQ1CKD6_STRDI|nr:hypothetical protein Sdia_12490 [Streptomyces diastaticus subsp. diastaticus]GGU35459.1 hypothetical protein GCM10015534_42680 [Streptomyces diastaticus subsp. diastaticus]